MDATIGTCSSTGTTNSTRLFDDFGEAVVPLLILEGLMSVVGLVGNITVLYVHITKYKKCNFRSFVLYLCALDMISCCFLVPAQMHGHLYYLKAKGEILCKVESFLNIGTSIAHIYGLLLIAVDRYRKVCHPHRWQLTRNAVRICMALSVCISFILASPVIELWGITHSEMSYKDCSYNITRCIQAENYADDILPTLYLAGLAPNFLVLGGVFVLYVLVFKKIALVATEERRLATKGSPQTVGITLQTGNDNSGLFLPPSPMIGMSPKEDMGYATDDEDDGEGDVSISNANSVDSLNIFKPTGNVGRKVRKRSKPDLARSRLAKNKRMTLLTFVFTIIFTITAILYISGGSVFTKKDAATSNTSLPLLLVNLFFLRLYYINFILHPILYGFLDPSFQRAVKKIPIQISNSLKRRSVTDNTD